MEQPIASPTMVTPGAAREKRYITVEGSGNYPNVLNEIRGLAFFFIQKGRFLSSSIFRGALSSAGRKRIRRVLLKSRPNMVSFDPFGCLRAFRVWVSTMGELALWAKAGKLNPSINCREFDYIFRFACSIHFRIRLDSFRG
jgi:hypothetical protein